MKKELKKEIGKRIRNLREHFGLTQDEMAAFFKIGRANYSRIETGGIYPNATFLLTLKKKFNISLNWLIANEGRMHIKRPKKQVEEKDYHRLPDEIKELLFYIEKIPMISHIVLGSFLEYKVKNKKKLIELLRQNNPKGIEGDKTDKTG